VTQDHLQNLNHVVSLLKTNRDSLIEFFTTNSFPLEVLSGGKDMSRDIYYYDFLKPGIRINHPVLKEIVSYPYIIYLNYTIFVPNIHIYKHKDVLPTNKIYQERHLHREFYGDPTYLRIHFPVTDCGEDCFMIYNEVRCTWKRGEVYVYDVHNCYHEFWNNSDKAFAVLLIDVLTGKN
jgi:Aspartyl/Asparaginyl beta-hydroxylase